MKKGLYAIALASVFLLGFSASRILEEAALDNERVTQVGIVVDDIEEATKAWAAFLGRTEVPQIMVAEGHDSRPTHFRGSSSDARAKLAFFQLENLTIELIEPLEGPSTWKEFLEEHGPGIHHIAFEVDQMENSVAAFSTLGISEVQYGGWGTGEYAYMDAEGSLALIIELLEHYTD
jgi:catechol 2,3-dioxygenase-like lactoylglutathione lyase family enzyme